MSVFSTIDSNARFLTHYRESADAYRKAQDELQWAREYTPDQVSIPHGSEWQHILMAEANCEEYRKHLVDLVRLVRVHLPDVYVKLKLIPDPGPWHSTPGFDWDAAIMELRTIEAAAAIRAEAGDTSQPESPPDQDLDGNPIPPDLRKWIKDLPPDDTPGLRPAYRREHVWLLWNTVEGLGPAAIRDRWNGLDVAVRKMISPRCCGTFGTDKNAGSNRVKQALVRARRESKTDKPKRTPKPSRRTTSKQKTAKRNRYTRSVTVQ